jgi:hypothetical protein
MMMYKEHDGCGCMSMEDHMGEGCHCGEGSKKEFKMAMLKKKEKMLEAKLEFIREIRGILEKSNMESEEKK